MIPRFIFDLLFKVTEVGVHLSSLSSIRKARFATAAAIDLKLGTYEPLGQATTQTKFWSGLVSWPVH
jgi:hypothetical protein